MSNIRRETAPDRLRKVVADLAAHNIEIPADVAAQVALLDRLDARPPQGVDIPHLIAAYIDEVRDGTLERMALLHVTHAARAEAWREARIKVAQTGLSALPSHGDDLTRQLAELAAPLLEEIAEAAVVDTHDVAALMRAGREDEARKVMGFDIACGKLRTLYDLRGRVTHGAGYGESPELTRATGYVGASCGVWRDPRKVRALGTAETTWREGIRAGGVMWFPLPAEAQAQAAKVIEEAQAAEIAEEADQHGRGFNVGRAVRVR